MKPRQLTPEQIRNLRYTEGEVPGGRWGKIHSGRMCPASDGTRWPLIVGGDQIIFTLLEKKVQVFVQDTTSFIQDLNAYPLEKAGKEALPMARFAQATVEFALGLAAVAGGPLAAVAVTGVDVYKFCFENGKLIVAVGKAWYQVARVRGLLMACTPSLHELLEATAWRASWEAVRSLPGLLTTSSAAMPASVADQAAGRLAGVVAGKLSMADLKSRLGVLKIVLQVLLAILLKAAPVAARAIGKTVGRGDADAAADLLAAAQRLGVSISANEAATEGPKIAAELKSYGHLVKPALEAAIKAIQAVEQAA